jgi:hypothetical protein
MADRSRPPFDRFPRLSRRRWLACSIAGTLALTARAEEPKAVDDEVAQLQELARKARLGPFRTAESEHYLGIGDAPDGQIRAALEVCEALAKSYQEHLRGRDREFAVELPRRKMTVVVLAGPKSYAAFLGEDPGAEVGGHYELDTNRLVTFDFQTSARANTFTLVHEATHQLTFNTGLLDRDGDVPVCISEGLAMYAETWLKSSPKLGQVNRRRLNQLREGGDWLPIPLAELLTRDGLFDDAATRPAADGESWLLVHYLLRNKDWTPKFRDYLVAIRSRRDAANRLADAEAHFKPLSKLETNLRKTAPHLR